MNRETERRFSEVPNIGRPRSKFKRSFTHKTTFDAADIIPIYLDQDILPGDTVSMKMSQVVRMATPLYPVMDNAYIDIMFFFIPDRLVWDHWQEFWGESKSKWYQTVEYEVPHIKTFEGDTFEAKSLADYFGLPIGIENQSVSALPFRAYCKVWNDWFRDENLQDEVPFTTGDSDAIVSSATQHGGSLLKANRYHDYFSSSLPTPQKGPDVLLPLGTWAPVQTRDARIYPAAAEVTGYPGLDWASETTSESFTENTFYNLVAKATGNVDPEEHQGFKTAVKSNTQTGGTTLGLFPVNLWADLSNATAATISSLRTAFAIQRFYEAQARGGSRYIEFLRNIFGVVSPDARLQRSEYLGGKRVPININQVLQTSATTEESPQGNTAAYSHTVDYSDYFTKSFTEAGILLGIGVIRTDHTYNQGLERGWSRRKWTDFYVPQFAHLSEQAILNKEIYAQGTDADDEAFGYQEAWADYRYKPSIVTAAMRTTYAQTLDAWHYADNYTEQPILGEEWIQETKANIDRTLAVSSDVENQFIADFYFTPTYVRPMPIYSVPGLIDHM